MEEDIHDCSWMVDKMTANRRNKHMVRRHGIFKDDIEMNREEEGCDNEKVGYHYYHY